MDVDNDVDSQLLQQFSSMGTTDREVLISEFQKLLGNRLNPESCAFFLDMNNWNLQAAICSYYDYEQPNIRLPRMLFIRDVTIGDGESVPPNTPFVKMWRIQNSGDEPWPPGCSLKFVGGDKLSSQDFVIVEALGPGQVHDISINMQSPSNTGIFQGQWRMTTPVGNYFGEVIWVIIQVEESGLLSLTQKLQSIGNQEFNHGPQNVTDNPFASPNKPGGPGGWSPTQSTVAQFGSTPSSPCSTPLQGTQVALSSSAPSTPASHVRVALFPTPEGSPQQDSSNQQSNDMDMS